jgi:branched-subunit amino acid aminotransferase/4-amino-4-deoxychorismate lyase
MLRRYMLIMEKIEDVKTIIGIEKGINKKYNTEYTVLNMTSEFDEYSKTKRAAVGRKAESVYIRGNVDVKLEEKVTLLYDRGFAGEAVVVGIKVIK